MSGIGLKNGQQTLQAVAHGGGPHGGAVAFKTPDFAPYLLRSRPAEPDGAHRFVGTAAAGAGDAGDRECHLRRGILQCTLAMARATGSLTAPWALMSASGTPSMDVFAWLE